MKRLKLYLETSVWNFYFADDAPEKKDSTLQFFQRVKQGNYDIFISEVVLTEISRASEEKKTMLLNVIGEYTPIRLELTEEVLSLLRKSILMQGYYRYERLKMPDMPRRRPSMKWMR